MIREEIETLEATLASYEFTHLIELVPPKTNDIDSGGGGEQRIEKHMIQLVIAPTPLDNQKIAIFVEEDSHYIPVQLLPRLVLKFTFELCSAKVGDYPQRHMPLYQIEGYFAKKAYQIYRRLEARFEPGSPCLFDWFSFAKDELFCDPQNIDQYSGDFFRKTEEFGCLLPVRNKNEL